MIHKTLDRVRGDVVQLPPLGRDEPPPRRVGVLQSVRDHPNHVHLIGLLALLALASFLVLRVVLFVTASVNAAPAALATVFAIGFLYDLVFALECATIGALLLALTPKWLLGAWPIRALGAMGVVLVVGAILFSAIAELVFWDEFGTRFNFIAVDYLVYTHEVIANIAESYPMGTILSGVLLASVVILWPFRAWIGESLRGPSSFRLRAATCVVLGAGTATAYLGLGQGLRKWSDDNYLNELASNGPYQFVAAFRNNALDLAQHYRTGDPARLGPLLHEAVFAPNDSPPLPGIDSTDTEAAAAFAVKRVVHRTRSERRLNVVLVSVESLSADFMGRYGNAQQLTPFLDRLAEESICFDNLYATGTRTDRGLEAITLSVPPMPGRSIVKRPNNAGYASLGSIFAGHGYDVAFLYGGRAYFDNMRTFFGGNGYRVVDQTDLSAAEVTFENAWGVCDGDLLRRTLAEADASHTRGAPFFFHVMTTSNHRPFTYPDAGVGISSGTGRKGAVRYTDLALEAFVEAAREHAWFEDTVFVVLADHCASSAGRTGLPVLRYHIPLMIHSPAHLEPQVVAKLASQIDLAPTLLALLGFEYESCFFGRDVCDADAPERALIGNYQELGLLEEDRLAILSPRKGLDVVENARESPRIHTAVEGDTLVLRAMAYYQGADSLVREGRLRARPFVRIQASLNAMTVPSATVRALNRR